MKTVAFAALLAAASAQVSIPSQTLNQAQIEALATLSAAQNQLNQLNSQMIADDKASQEAAIFSQSAIAHESDMADLGSLDSSDNESSGMDSVDEHDSDSGAASISKSVLALAVAVGAAMF
ncbi:hypothetical protein IWW55_002694 [Coemansia sp. RSA 2706]|nr:hypothetical protein IWW55_002694 [Coemansia sp. RSA 2706]KAJ2305536.1 hypothetical protein IWW54_005050 [Coemansia sp. RSA 2705]KAJ2317947.1 hypothetical protein IWW52_002842 [Coemansia sp. RSA 2704]KAJ2326227.1 hypothetical protein IWW51_002391 [Coemansia sp. RSA 2702]KAJ2360348.1 hypothetical protein H4S01_005771 [Coemansia sp. RSA 2610]KAJ2376899.1 hypothetical protein H4S02_007798 [Coemansia sp. RSA 2611]